MNVTITLTLQQAKQLASLLWEVCSETEEGVKTLREDLPESEIRRKVVAAISPGTCPDCGGCGAVTENGVHYCNCEEAA